MIGWRSAAFAAGLALGFATSSTAQGNRTPVDLARYFEPKIDVMIPMRDGARLHTEIYLPKNAPSGPRPILLERTPYYANPGERQISPRLQLYSEFFDDGYIVVLQDLRGRFFSEGQYVTLRPQRDPADPNGIDESTDFYDTIDWLVKRVPHNNGRVGTLGISYGGFLSLRAMMDPHPALKAVSPQAACADMFVRDDFHHNGAFRLHYSFVAAAALEATRSYGMFWDQYDLYEWFLDLGPLSVVNRRLLFRESPLWNAFEEHPNLDDTWERQFCGTFPWLQGPTVPALHVLGWYDAEDFAGPLEVYQRMERDDRARHNLLVIGPWTHGGWTFDEEGRKVNAVDFGAATSRWFRQEVHRPWFAHWLDGKPMPDLPEALVFQTGSNRWERFDRWPPLTSERKLYLRAEGGLGFEAPRGDVAPISFVSDPANPVPFQPRPVRYPEGWSDWQAGDQRVAHGRPDVLTWVSEPLTEELTLAGDAVAHLFASTTGSDADWVVKLIDVYPDDHPDRQMAGYQYMVAGDVFRARFRESFTHPKPVVPNEVAEYVISLRDRSHRFAPGHRLMVQVQSTWFPLIDRNPQRYVPNIFLAAAEDFEKATHSVHVSARHPSHIALPIR
ncbi:MAG: CocE/NonD family hydrolase [Gemmatimonadales bacterium]